MKTSTSLMQSDIIYLLFKKLRKFAIFVSFIIIYIVSAIIVYHFLFIIFVPLSIYRQIIKLIVKIRDPKCGQLLTGLSAFIAHKDPYSKPLVTVAPYITFTSKIDRSHIVDVLNERLIKPNLYPELQQRIIRKFGYFFWCPVENFNVESHVKYLNPECPDEPVTRKELRRLGYERMGFLPFDSELSPWDLVLVPNLIDENNPEVKSAVYIRANHCLMDGYSIITFMQKCALKPWSIPVAQAYLKGKSGNGVTLKNVARYLELILTGPYHALHDICFSNDNSEFLRKALFSSSSFGEEQDGLIKETEPRRFDGDRLKRLRNKYNVSLPSVLLSLSAQGIIKYIKYKCNSGFASIPKQIYLQVAFPIPGHPDAMTNHWTFVRFCIKVDKDDDPVKLLKDIHKQYEYLKCSVLPLVNFVSGKLIGMLPISLFPKMEHLPIQTATVTNVPGPVEQIDMFGYTWDSASLLGSPASGNACVVCCQYSFGKFWIDVSGVRSLFTSQEDLLRVENYVHNVFNELERMD